MKIQQSYVSIITHDTFSETQQNVFSTNIERVPTNQDQSNYWAGKEYVNICTDILTAAEAKISQDVRSKKFKNSKIEFSESLIINCYADPDRNIITINKGLILALCSISYSMHPKSLITGPLLTPYLTLLTNHKRFGTPLPFPLNDNTFYFPQVCAAISFLILHEFSHVHLGHKQYNADKRSNHKMEFDADINAISNHRDSNLLISGAILFFLLHSIIFRELSLESPTHPKTIDRIKNITTYYRCKPKFKKTIQLAHRIIHFSKEASLTHTFSFEKASQLSALFDIVFYSIASGHNRLPTEMIDAMLRLTAELSGHTPTQAPSHDK